MIELKIKRHVYKITKDDEFMDNGSCVQLISQSKEMTSWGSKPWPVLSKKAIEKIAEFERVEIDNAYEDNISIFSLEPK